MGRCAVLTGVEVVLNRGVGDDDGNTDSQNGGGGNHVVLFLWLGEKGGVQVCSAKGPVFNPSGAALTLHFAIGQDKCA